MVRADIIKKTNNDTKLKMYTPIDLEQILHIGRSKVYKLLLDGTIKSIKIGKNYRVPEGYLLEYLYPDKYERKE